MRCLLLGAAVGLASCVITPVDPFPAAQRAVDEGDLLRALAYLDQIPPAHPRSRMAKTLAALVETRIVDCQRWMVAGMQLRADGQPEAAAVALNRALALWPEAIGLQRLIDGKTAEGISGLDLVQRAPPDAAPAPAGEEPAAVDLGPSGAPSGSPSLPAGALAVPEPPAVVLESPNAAAIPADRVQQASHPEPEPPRAPQGGEPSTPNAEPPGQSGVLAADQDAPIASAEIESAPASALDLPSLRALVQGRDQGRAIAQLSVAHRAHPENLEVRMLLAGLLRQRALVAYGRGWLDSAVEDWERVVSLIPDDLAVRGHLKTARAELARRHDRADRKKNAGG